MLGGAGGMPSDKAYNIEGVTLNLDVAMQGKAAAVRGISVDGAVVFKEASATLPGVEPMQIVAEHLNVTGADTPNAQIEIRGGGGENGLPQQIAELTANGAKLRVPAIALQRGTSEAIVNAPGEVQLLVDRDMAGNPLAAAAAANNRLARVDAASWPRAHVSRRRARAARIGLAADASARGADGGAGQLRRRRPESADRADRMLGGRAGRVRSARRQRRQLTAAS